MYNCAVRRTAVKLNVIADTILSDRWNSIKLPERNLSTIFISTDYKFDILRLVCIMENRLKEALQKQNPKFKKSLPLIVEKIDSNFLFGKMPCVQDIKWR